MDGLEKETAGMGATNIPEVGKVYHVFDDGKITLSRHMLVKCVAVIPFNEFINDHKYKKPLLKWMYSVSPNHWVYRDNTDYIVVCEDVNDVASERALRGGDWDKLLYYTRTLDGGWFGFGTLLDDGLLDVDRSVWKDFYKAAHNPKRFTYDARQLKDIETLDKF